MWISFINNDLEELENHYEENDNYNDIVFLTLNENKFLLEKTECLKVIKKLMDNDCIKHYDIIMDIINNIDYYSHSNYERGTLHRMKQHLEQHRLENLYKVSLLECSTTFQRIKHKNNLILQQYKHFMSFNNNQNNYDNMISILKIIGRLKEYDIDIDYSWFNFNSKHDISNTFSEYILYEGLKEFNSMRFLI